MIDDEKDFLVVRELLSHIAIRMFAEQGRGMIAGPFEESETHSDEEVVSSGNWFYVPRGRCGEYIEDTQTLAAITELVDEYDPKIQFLLAAFNEGQCATVRIERLYLPDAGATVQ